MNKLVHIIWSQMWENFFLFIVNAVHINKGSRLTLRQLSKYYHKPSDFFHHYFYSLKKNKNEWNTLNKNKKMEHFSYIIKQNMDLSHKSVTLEFITPLAWSLVVTAADSSTSSTFGWSLLILMTMCLWFPHNGEEGSSEFCMVVRFFGVDKVIFLKKNSKSLQIRSIAKCFCEMC